VKYSALREQIVPCCLKNYKLVFDSDTEQLTQVFSNSYEIYGHQMDIL